MFSQSTANRIPSRSNSVVPHTNFLGKSIMSLECFFFPSHIYLGLSHIYHNARETTIYFQSVQCCQKILCYHHGIGVIIGELGDFVAAVVNMHALILLLLYNIIKNLSTEGKQVGCYRIALPATSLYVAQSLYIFIQTSIKLLKSCPKLKNLACRTKNPMRVKCFLEIHQFK